MAVSRRTILGGAGIGAFATLAGFFPELATAKSVTKSGAGAKVDRAIAVAQQQPRVKAALAKYKSYTVQWDPAGSGGDDHFAWVRVGGANHSAKKSYILQIFVDLDQASVPFILVSEFAAAGEHTRIKLFADDKAAEVFWSGRLNGKTGDLVPDSNYPSIQELKETARPASCASVINRVCDASMAGNSAIACAIVAASASVFAGLGCAAVMYMITWYGCSKVTRMICN